MLPAPLTPGHVEVVVQPIDHFANPPVGVDAPGVFSNQAERDQAAEAARTATKEAPPVCASATGPLRTLSHGFDGGLYSHTSAFGGCGSAGLLEFRDEAP